MKVVLTNLNGVKKEANGRLRHFAKAGSRWPMTVGYSKSVDYYPFPFYLAYATSLLKEIPGVEAVGIDGVARDFTQEDLFQEISAQSPQIVVAELTMINLKDDLAFLKKLKTELNCRLIVTGVYVSAFKSSVLIENPFIDFAIHGEYEISLRGLIDLLKEDRERDVESVEGIICHSKEGVFCSPKAAYIPDFNALPFPDREDFPPQMYSDFALHTNCFHITATRGCPAGCVFCVERHVTYNSPKYRVRDPKKLVDEMEFCIHQYKARQFYFDDQSLVVHKQFLLNFCQEMINRQLNIPWTCMGDAMFIDYPMLEKMKEAGCIGMKFGIESANAQVLKNTGKPLNTAKALQVVEWCKELGIITHATFCIGLPGETRATVQETLDYLEKLNVDSAQVSKAVPFPGTPFYAWAKEKGFLVSEDLDLYDGAAKTVLNYPDFSSADMEHWYGVFLKRVSRKRLWNYVKHPASSSEIIFNLMKEKGPLRAIQSISCFVARAC
jgi:radical SAM superfamily enzyme YgiQ (UPF0313 family)